MSNYVTLVFVDGEKEETFIKRINKKNINSQLDIVKPFHDKEITTLYSDGAMNKNTGDYAWGSVTQQDGYDMLGIYKSCIQDMDTLDVILPRNIGMRTIIKIKFSDVKSQQHNGAELLAFVVALRIAKVVGSVKRIKCDSSTIISWSKKGPQPSTKKSMDKKKLQYIEESIKLRNEFENSGGVVEKISGDDNLADLGYH